MKLIDEKDRTLDERPLADLSDRNGPLIVARAPEQTLPNRVRLLAADGKKRFESDWLDTDKVSGKQTVPISLMSQATRGLLDDFAMALKQRTTGTTSPN